MSRWTSAAATIAQLLKGTASRVFRRHNLYPGVGDVSSASQLEQAAESSVSGSVVARVAGGSSTWGGKVADRRLKEEEGLVVVVLAG